MPPISFLRQAMKFLSAKCLPEASNDGGQLPGSSMRLCPSLLPLLMVARNTKGKHSMGIEVAVLWQCLLGLKLKAD